jgi:hypothetical protein
MFVCRRLFGGRCRYAAFETQFVIARRGFLGGLLFAPAIIRTPGLLMPVKSMPRPVRYLPLPPLRLEGTSIEYDNLRGGVLTEESLLRAIAQIRQFGGVAGAWLNPPTQLLSPYAVIRGV